MEELKNLYKEIDLLSRYDIEKFEIINSMYESFSIDNREEIRKAILNANIRLLNKNESYLVEYEPYHTFIMRIRKQHKPNDIMEYICDCSISINHVKNLFHIYKRRVNIEKDRRDKLKLSKKIYDNTSENERRLLERSITENVVNLLEHRPKSFITDLFVDIADLFGLGQNPDELPGITVNSGQTCQYHKKASKSSSDYSQNTIKLLIVYKEQIDIGALDAIFNYVKNNRNIFYKEYKEHCYVVKFENGNEWRLTGWCPKGRRWEGEGKIPDRYPLQETKTNNYKERTELNVKDADATLILKFSIFDSDKDGTGLTIEKANELNKLLKNINLDEDDKNNISEVFKWIKEIISNI
ncbi:18173_t:CDS:2 [Gigaspora rosea]|nr:18173_t:CDS:2 [Gigaspora rosea]